MSTVMFVLGYLYILWVLFLSVMALKSKWTSLSLPIRVLAVPSVILALVMDIVFNWTLAVVLFLDMPHQWTFSQRVGEYKRRAGWRATLAYWICDNLLDPFEVDGAHCKGSR